jgi:hypothetical protein
MIGAVVSTPIVRAFLRLVVLSCAAALAASCGARVGGTSTNPPTPATHTTSTTVAGGPGAPSTTSAPPTPTSTAIVADGCGVVPAPQVVITTDSVPCHVSTHVGVAIHVVLDPGFDWATPASDSGAVDVARVVRQPTGRLDADLVAVRAGQATVSATGSVLCPAGRACPALARLWQIRVTVAS